MNKHIAIPLLLVSLTGCKGDITKEQNQYSIQLFPQSELDNKGSFNGVWLAQVNSFDRFGDVPINSTICRNIPNGGFYYIKNGIVYPFLENDAIGSINTKGQYSIYLGHLNVSKAGFGSEKLPINLVGELSSYTNQGAGSVDLNLPGQNEKCLAGAFVEKYTQVQFNSGKTLRISKFIWSGKEVPDAQITIRANSISSMIPYSITSEQTSLNCKGFWFLKEPDSREGKTILRCNDDHTLEARWTANENFLVFSGNDNQKQSALFQFKPE